MTSSPKVEDLDLWEAKLFQEPLILLMSGKVLVGPEGMGHAVNMVNDRTSEVVGGVCLVSCTRDVKQR